MGINELLKYGDFDLIALREKFNIGNEDIKPGYSYSKLEGLTLVQKEKVLPGRFYYSGNNLAMIYISNLNTLNYDDIIKIYGAGELLRSRAGKTSNLHFYNNEGFALSECHKQLEFMEIFKPMSLSEYKDKIYEEVLFIR